MPNGHDNEWAAARKAMQNEAEEIAALILAEMLAAAASSDDDVVFDDEQIAYIEQALSDAAQEAINRRRAGAEVAEARAAKLLAACKEALDHLDGSPVEVHEAFAVLEDAIAKAAANEEGDPIHIKIEGVPGSVHAYTRVRWSFLHALLSGWFEGDRILWRATGDVVFDPKPDPRDGQTDLNPWIELRDGDHLVYAPRGSC